MSFEVEITSKLFRSSFMPLNAYCLKKAILCSRKLISPFKYFIATHLVILFKNISELDIKLSDHTRKFRVLFSLTKALRLLLTRMTGMRSLPRFICLIKLSLALKRSFFDVLVSLYNWKIGGKSFYLMV